MSRRRYLFDPPERFVAGTIGQPGDRTFFLQARDGGRIVSIVLEKVQVAVLADRLGDLLTELERRGVAAAEERVVDDDTGPLDEPLNEAFRAGSLTLGWDGEAERVLVEARAQPEDGEEIDPDEDDDEDEDGPDLLRVRLTAEAAKSFAMRAARVVGAGRPPCPLCGAPLDPQGHICPRRKRPLPQLAGRPVFDRGSTLDVLREGDIEIVGRIVASSNNAMLVTMTRRCPDPTPEPEVVLDAIYKPTLGERPLDDFPDGTLARREVAAWHVSEASGWGIVPPTVLRDGPFGEGMVQAFVEADPEVDVVAMVVEDDARLRRMAVLDAVMNNTDRKGGHILPVDGGRHVYGVDHGVCFSPVPEAADRAVGLARDAAGARRGGRRPNASGRRWTASWPMPWPGCSRGPRCGRRRGGRRAAGVLSLPVPVTGLASDPLATVLGCSSRRRGGCASTDLVSPNQRHQRRDGRRSLIDDADDTPTV
jgi:uncharacterized repeat protein (TIGR03847 family)